MSSDSNTNIFYYLLFHAKEHEHKPLRRLICFPIGLAVGFLFYWTVIRRFGYPEMVDSMILTALPVVTALSFTTSVQIRAIFSLLVPIFAGRTLRSFLVALLVTTLIENPFNNIADNIRNGITTVGCSTALKSKLKANKQRLIYKPIYEIARKLVLAKDDLQAIGNQTSEEIYPLEEELSPDEAGNNKTVRKLDERKQHAQLAEIQRKYRQTMSLHGADTARYFQKKTYQCVSDVLERRSVCLKGVEEGHGRCELEFSYDARGFECRELRTKYRKVCESLDESTDYCIRFDYSTADIEGAPKRIKQARSNFVKLFQANPVLKVTHTEPELNITVQADAMQILADQFEQRKAYLFIMKSLVRYVIIFIFLNAFLTANSYHSEYLKDISHDNIYIGTYFHRIDERRRNAHKMTLLPVKKVEGQELIHENSLKMSANEFKKVKTILLIIIPVSILIALIYYVDHIVSFLLDSFIRNSKDIVYTQEGYHHIGYRVVGEGMVAKLFRRVIDNVSHNETVSIRISGDECLKDSIITSGRIYFLTASYLAGIVFLTLLESYILRARHLICGLYYPKREKSRILYLYNDSLKKRKKFLEYKINRLTKLVAKKGIKQVVGSSRYEESKRRCFGLCKKATGKVSSKCIICEEILLATQCDNCGANYCKQCFDAIGQDCFACAPKYINKDDAMNRMYKDDEVTKFAKLLISRK
ncbi:E3 ubiquitin-protein ligase DCST1 [Halotydeus destructor]|nr:E3 ubiquitin-protein ligase DCST1 [Halotydeus destructor]